MASGTDSTTLLLTEWRDGNQEAGQRLFALSYQELRRLAAWHLQRERPGHTLQATALVNELYLKLFGGDTVTWQSRAHFFALLSRQIDDSGRISEEHVPLDRLFERRR